MKKTKKLISILLSVLMLLSITSGLNFSAYALTSGDFEYSVSENKATITKYNGSAKTITIPSKIGGYTVTSIGDKAFNACDISSVTIPEGVISIGNNAFRGCSFLTSLTIPDSVTSIGAEAFSSCSNLTSITIPDSVTSIGIATFRACMRLTSVTLSNNLTSIENYVFSDCQQLTNITIPGSVTSIGVNAFNSCRSLTNVTILDGVTSIENNAFRSCSTLTSVTIPNTVTSIGENAFLYCSSLTSIIIPDSVTSIETAAFEYCTSLTSVTISNSVTSIGAFVFDSCTSLPSVTIPDSVTIINRNAFSNCTDLRNVTIPNSVTKILYLAFENCTKLSNVYYAGSEEQWNDISIDGSKGGNENLLNATIHYNYVPTCSHINISSQVIQPTCTTGGYTLNTCNDCGYEYNSDETSALGHLFENYTAVDSENHKAICSRENCNEVDINSHIFVGDTCEDCGYATVDTTAYDDALAEANAIMGASDYTTKYLASSRTAYENAVNAAIRDDFLTQEEADSAASAIISAKSLLTYSQSTVEFYIVDESGNITNQISETVSYGDVLTLNAGDYISDSDRITKWVAISGVNSNESKVATSQRSYTMVVTKPVKIYAHYVTISAEPTVKYSRITFIGKNGCVIEVKYVKEGEDLDTSTVEAPVIPFYEFIGWNKSSVTANGSDIFVKANYKFIETEEDKCKVHYVQNDNIIVKYYAYDSFVYIYGAEDKKLALSTDGTTAGIITYLDENAFYAPHCSDIYVIEVEEMNSSIGITGSYSYVTDENKIVAFNCKAYLPEGFTLVECGLIASSEKGSMKIEAESVSPRGEYCIKVLLDNNTQITAVKGKAYLVFKNSSGDLVTIESDEITQSL